MNPLCTTLLILLRLCAGCSADNSVLPVDELTGNEQNPSVEWVEIPSGSFTFGSPADTPCRAVVAEEEVPVTLTRSFFAGATEVTQAQWKALDLPNPSKDKGDNKPVTFVNFYEAAAWCNKLSRLEGLDTCYDLSICKNSFGTGCAPDEPWAEEGCWDDTKNFNCAGDIEKYPDRYSCPGYRLPTTAEWEYAAKAGTTTHTYGGDVFAENGGACGDQTSLEDIAWYCHNSGGAVHSVQEKLPNPWGLYDTLGNVDEWVDYFTTGQSLNWQNSDESLIDPTGPLTGEMKEVRGRAFNSTGCLVRPSMPNDENPYTRLGFTGFRPVRTIFEK